MNSLLSIGQLVIAVIIIVLVLLQEGGGLSGIFGGSSSDSFHVRRGLEKIVFIGTLTSALLFVGLSLLNLVF